MNDLTAFIDYILEATNNNDLTYIGYSIGATESYVLLSKLPEYNKKIRLLISIAPFAFWKKPFIKDSLVNEIINKIKVYKRLYKIKNLRKTLYFKKIDRQKFLSANFQLLQDIYIIFFL